MKPVHQRGITLIELMTVMVIVGILAAIALPSYSQYVRRSDRAAAKTALLEDAQFLERNFTVNNTYNIDASGDPMVAASLPVTQSPKDGDAKYTITLDEDALGTTTFTLHAVPVAGGPATDDPCGTLSITHTGEKSATGGTVATCWSK
jgi:type IV pilus assembly protein PilE